MNSKEINLYIGNHSSRNGIEDYINIFLNVFEKRGWKLKVNSIQNKNKINLVIDEFSAFNSCDYSFNNADKNIIVLTEFFNKNFFVISLNNFGGIFEAGIISLINVCLRMCRQDFPAPSSKDLIILLAYLPILSVKYFLDLLFFLLRRLLNKKAIFPLSVNAFLKENSNLIYFHMRYLGLINALEKVDGIIVSHPSMAHQYKSFVSNDKRPNYLGVIYPEFDKKLVLQNLGEQKKLYIEISGKVTKYRKKWTHKLNRMLLIYGVRSVFELCKVRPFDNQKADLNQEKKIKAAYSLHPPQTPGWKYCSPTRLYRALAIDHNIPIITKNFNQHPIENICERIESIDVNLFEVIIGKSDFKNKLDNFIKMHNDITYRNNVIEKRINEYNELAQDNNDKVINNLSLLINNDKVIN
jgi:hypothetical protein